MNYTISVEQASTKCYRRALQEELDIGRHIDEKDLEANRINRPEILAYKAKVLGDSKASADYSSWTRFLVSEFGHQERCLSLGSGVGRIEKYLVSMGLTDRMETVELCADVNERVRMRDDRIETSAGDLNFIDLPANQYDLILCHGVLHHLIKLEHVLYQINRALKSNGLFLVYEYIGESRWQFDEERLEFLRRHFTGIRFNRPPAWSVRGFESIRSGDLLSLIQAQFGDKTVRAVLYGGAYFPFIITTTGEADDRLCEVIALDEEISSDGSLAACYHMGLYRKSARPAVKAQQWSMSILESTLCPRGPLSFRLRQLAKRSPIGPLLIRNKRVITSWLSQCSMGSR